MTTSRSTMDLQRVRKLSGLFSALLLLFCPALNRPAAAQFDTGAIVGMVIDPSGAKVPKATVTLRETQKGITLKTVTTSSGEYTFPSVAVGTYVVIVEAKGVSEATSDPFDVAVSGRNRIDIPLSINASESIPEFFNVLNHVNWLPPGAGINSATSFGYISAAQAQRELQFAVRLTY